MSAENKGLIGERIPFRHGNDRPQPERTEGGWQVHNHGPEEGRGLACREWRIGECRAVELDAAAEYQALLRECARHLRATTALFAVLPASYRAAHLSLRAADLARRIERATPQPEVTEE